MDAITPILVEDDDDDMSVVLIGGEAEEDHFAEVFSPPRVVFAVRDKGLKAQLSLDLKTGFDLLTIGGRGAALRLLNQHVPEFIMLSPPCTMYSQLQVCFNNFERMNAATVYRRKQEARVLLEFAVSLATKALQEGRYFCLEHPYRATSWNEPCLRALADNPGCFTVDFDQCRTGLCCPETMQPIRKRARLLSNAPCVRDVFQPLQCECQGPHRRVAGHVNGVPLSQLCQEYTPQLCEKLAQAVLATVS